MFRQEFPSMCTPWWTLFSSSMWLWMTWWLSSSASAFFEHQTSPDFTRLHQTSQVQFLLLMFPSIVVMRFNFIHILNHFDTQWFYNFHNLDALAVTWLFILVDVCQTRDDNVPVRSGCPEPVSPMQGTRLRPCWCIALVVLPACTAWKPLAFQGGASWHLLASMSCGRSVDPSIYRQSCGALPHLCRRPRLSVWCHGAFQRLRHWNFRARIPLTDEWIFWGSKGWLKAVTMHVLFVSGRHCTIKTSRRDTYIIYYNMWTWSQRIFHSGVPVKTQGKSWASASGYPTTESLSWAT